MTRFGLVAALALAAGCRSDRARDGGIRSLGSRILTKEYGSEWAAIRPVVFRLKSDDPETIEKAEAELLARGPELRRALDGWAYRYADERISTRVRAIIAEIDRRGRVSFVRPQPRLNVKLQDVNVREAARRVLEPYGLRGDFGLGGRKRPVSLSLENAALWEALEALAAAARYSIIQGAHFRTEFWPAPTFVSGHRVFDSGDVRIVAEPNGGYGGLYLDVTLVLPPGSLPTSCWIEATHILDGGRVLKAGLELLREKDAARRIDRSEWKRGRCSRLRLLGRQFVGRGKEARAAGSTSKEDLVGVSHVSFIGKLVMLYPHDLQRTRVDVAEVTGTVEAVVDGVRLSLRRFLGRKMIDYELSVEVLQERAGPRRLLAWVEDSRGTWLRDVHHPGGILRKRGDGGKISWKTNYLKGPATTLVVARYVGEDRVEIPFRIADLPVGPQPRTHIHVSSGD